MRLRAGRELSQYGGLGVARELRHMRSTPAVYWSPTANSYVIVERPDGTYRIVSINGIGEIRWEIDPLSLGWSGDNHAADAVAYFLDGGNA